jgi:hypothetical protein
VPIEAQSAGRVLLGGMADANAFLPPGAAPANDAATSAARLSALFASDRESQKARRAASSPSHVRRLLRCAAGRRMRACGRARVQQPLQRPACGAGGAGVRTHAGA